MPSIPFRAVQRLPRRFNPLRIRRFFRTGLPPSARKGSCHILFRVLLVSRISLSLSKPAQSLKGQFGPNGALYDGWESRRHNPDCDW
jgi:hypothetical protein